MTASKLSLALALALFSLPMAAAAQDQAESTEATTEQTQSEETAAPADEAVAEEEESNFSWNLALTSDYVFRGVSQNSREPALQGGLDYSFGDTGFYVGTWGSNVDFGDGSPDLEIDTYIGWNTDLSDSFNLDVMLSRYNYFGEDEASFGTIDYNELIGVVTWNEMIAFTAAYTNNYSNTGINSSYVNVTGEWEVAESFTFSAGVGRTEFEDSDGYTDWMLGISRDFGPVNAALNYYDTNVDGERLSDALVLTFKIEG
ncbi:MAG: TorF family putative porin [Arenimonas sp.]